VRLLPSSEITALYILDLHTRAVSMLPESTGHFSPRWSPDGRFIVAMRSDNRHLDTFELTSKRWQKLTQVAGGYPNWSHDGNYVYFVLTGSGDRAIFRVGIQERVVEHVANLSAVVRGPFITEPSSHLSRRCAFTRLSDGVLEALAERRLARQQRHLLHPHAAVRALHPINLDIYGGLELTPWQVPHKDSQPGPSAQSGSHRLQ